MMFHLISKNGLIFTGFDSYGEPNFMPPESRNVKLIPERRLNAVLKKMEKAENGYFSQIKIIDVEI